MRRSRVLLLVVAVFAVAGFALVAAPRVVHRLTTPSSAAAASTTPPPGAGVAVPDTGGGPAGR